MSFSFKKTFLIFIICISVFDLSADYLDPSVADILRKIDAQQNVPPIYAGQDGPDKAIQELTLNCINNILNFADSKESFKKLEKIVDETYATHAKIAALYQEKVIVALEVNFLKLCNAPYGLEIVNYLQETLIYYKIPTDLLRDLLIDNFDTLITNKDFLKKKQALKIFCNHNLKSSDQELIERIIKSWMVLNPNPSDEQVSFLLTLLAGSGGHLFTTFLSQSIKNIIECDSEIYFDLAKEAVPVLMPIIIENLLEVYDNYFIMSFLRKNLKENSYFVEAIIEKIKENPLALCQSSYADALLEELILYESSLITVIEFSVINNMKIINRNLIEFVKKHTNDCKKLKQSIRCYVISMRSFDAFIKMILYNNACSKEDEKIKTIFTTSTIHHLQYAIKNKNKGNLLAFMCNLERFEEDKALYEMVSKVIIKEKELEIDYYTFIHGQRLQYLFLEQLHTFLKNIFLERLFPNFLFLHVKKDPNDLLQQKSLRKKLLKNGAKDRDDENMLLFTNGAFFGNFTNPGSSSEFYITKNINNKDIGITIKEIFELHNLENVYQKYKRAFKDLYKKFINLSRYGACILIAIPKKTINKHIFLAHPFGYKKFFKSHIDDINYLMDYIKNQPEDCEDIDRLEFCIPMTTDKKGGLNPESGIKMFPIIAGDQQQIDDFYREQQILFEQIKYDVINTLH